MQENKFLTSKAALITLLIGCFVISVSMGIRQTYGLFFQFFENDLNISNTGYDSALQVSNKLQELYFEEKFDKCILVFNKFKSAISQEVTKQQLIPLDVSNSSKEENADDSSAKAIYDYEPDEETILKDLLPKNVSIQIFKVLLESDAGEHGARMAAMDNATRNAGEMIDSLTLKYNRTRQAFITKELIEIISGAESV